MRGEERLAEEPVGQAEQPGDEDERSNPGGHVCGSISFSLLERGERRGAVGEREMESDREMMSCVGSPEYDGWAEKKATHRDRRVEKTPCSRPRLSDYHASSGTAVESNPGYWNKGLVPLFFSACRTSALF